MAKQANRMMIGVFVVIAVFIMAASLVVFGSGKFFKKTVKCVMYFDGSVKGLSVGAPVLFQGVQIGSVVSIILEVDPSKLQLQIPVVIEYEPEKFHVAEGARNCPRDPRKTIPKLIERGLRAQLAMQSFITGQLAIEIGFYPDSALCYAPAKIDKVYKDYIVIPTCQSTTERLSNALAKLDLAGLEKHLESAMDGIAKLVNNPDLAASIRGLKDTLQDARKLVTRRWIVRWIRWRTDVKKTVKDFGKLAGNVDDQVGGVATGFDKTMSKARGLLSEDSPLIVDLENTLQEISAMSRSIRQLTNYLDQHPEALIRGKGKPNLEGNNMRVAPFSRGLPVILALAAIFLGGCQESIAAFLHLEPDTGRPGDLQAGKPGSERGYRHRPRQAGRLPRPVYADHPHQRQSGGKSPVRSLGRLLQG